MTQEMKVKGIPQETFNKINLYFAQSKFRDRSAFVINALETYMLYNDSTLIRLLPDTTRILTEDVIAKEIKRRGNLLELTLTAIQKNTELLQEVWGLLNNTLPPIEDENENF